MIEQGGWASSEGVRRSMRSNKSRDTLPELAVRRELHRRGYRYRVSMRPVPGLRRTADIVFTRRRVAVCLDGCFWHGCPEHHTVARTNADFWASKVKANKERDSQTTRLWRQAGWTVLRFWEHELVDQVVDSIALVLRSLQRPDSSEADVRAD